MADTYNGAGFDPNIDELTRLSFIINKKVPTVAVDLSGSQAALVTVANGATNMDTFLQTFFPSNPSTASIPQTWDSFISQLATFGGTSADPDNETQPPLSTFLAEFQAVLKYMTDINALPNGAQIDVKELFTNAFSSFLKNYEYLDGKVGNFGPLSTFMDNWSKYLTAVAYVQTSSDPTLLSYQQVYSAYFSDDITNLSAQLLTLIQNSTDKDGYFLPGHNFGDFLNQITAAYTKALAGSASSTITSVGAASHSDGPRIILKILELLIGFIEVTQQVSIVQAQRLGILSNWQKAYTNLMGEIRSFVKQGPEWRGSRTDNVDHLDDDQRKDMNDQNNIYTPTLQSRRQVVSDDAKALQSSVNQSQDTVQNEVSNVSSFIQQLSSLLSSIYK